MRQRLNATKRFYLAAPGGVDHENLPYVSDNHDGFATLDQALAHASQEATDNRTCVYVYECRPIKKIGSFVKVEDVVEDRSSESRGFRLFGGGGDPTTEKSNVVHTEKKIHPIR